MRLIPYKLSFAVVLLNRGWVSTQQAAMIHGRIFNACPRREICWQTLKGLQGDGLVKCRVKVVIRPNNQDRNLWQLTAKGNRQINGELRTLPQRIYLKSITVSKA